MVVDARAELPGKAAPLILLLMNVSERRLDVRCRDAEAAPNDWRAAAGTERGKAVREITKQKVEAVGLLERVQLRGTWIDPRDCLGVRPLDFRTESSNVTRRHEAHPHAVVPRRAERLAFVRDVIHR